MSLNLERRELAVSDWVPGNTKTITLTEAPDQETRYMAAIHAVDSFGMTSQDSPYGRLQSCTPGGEPPAKIDLLFQNIRMLPERVWRYPLLRRPMMVPTGSKQISMRRRCISSLTATQPKRSNSGSCHSLAHLREQKIDLGRLEEDTDYRLSLHAVDDWYYRGETAHIDFTMLDFTAPDAVNTLGMTTVSTSELELAWFPSCDNVLRPDGTCRSVDAYRIICGDGLIDVSVTSPEIQADGLIRYALEVFRPKRLKPAA